MPTPAAFLRAPLWLWQSLTELAISIQIQQVEIVRRLPSSKKAKKCFGGGVGSVLAPRLSVEARVCTLTMQLCDAWYKQNDTIWRDVIQHTTEYQW